MNVYASVALSGDRLYGRSVAPATILSTPADWREVMRLRAWADAILVGAETVRRDDPSAHRARRSAPPGAPCGKPAGRPREGHAEPFAATRPRVELLHRRLRRTDRLHRQRCRIAARNSGRNRPYPRPFGGEDPHRTGKAGLRTAARRGRPAHTRPFFCGGLVDTLRMAVNPAVRVGDRTPPVSNRLSIRHASRSSADSWKEWR